MPYSLGDLSTIAKTTESRDARAWITETFYELASDSKQFPQNDFIKFIHQIHTGYMHSYLAEPRVCIPALVRLTAEDNPIWQKAVASLVILESRPSLSVRIGGETN